MATRNHFGPKERTFLAALRTAADNAESPTQARAYRTAADRLAKLRGWSVEDVRDLLREMLTAAPN